jgi:undecaprenyl-diphosphatase
LSTALQAALLGAVQGLTEFVPISSTAHLLIFEQLLGYRDPDGAFAVMIQLGSILAVMWLYRARLMSVAAGLRSDPRARRFALMIVAASVPALVAGALLADYVKAVLYTSVATWATAFIVGGVVMLLIERRRAPAAVNDIHDVDRIPLARAVAIGSCQMVALIPGVSRAGATIIGGLLLGLDRRTAAEFSFFLAMPIMLAAFVHDFVEVLGRLTADRAIEIGIGFLLAFVAAAAVVKPFLEFVTRRGFAPFAWYRIAVGIALFAALAAGWKLHAVAAP